MKWFQCGDCIFATNSPQMASTHEAKTGHPITEEPDLV